MLIYKIINNINGKLYIGQTIQESPGRRWSVHKRGKEPSAIGAAIRKYGIGSFSFEIIERCVSMEELNKREEELIAQFNTLAPNGYNLLPGGRNRVMLESSKLKISLANSGSKNGRYGIPTVASAETRAKISKSRTGQSISGASRMGRTKYTHTYIAKMAEKKKVQNKGASNPNAKVVDINGEKYLTMKDASLRTGISLYKIRKIIAKQSYQ